MVAVVLARHQRVLLLAFVLAHFAAVAAFAYMLLVLPSLLMASASAFLQALLHIAHLYLLQEAFQLEEFVPLAQRTAHLVETVALRAAAALENSLVAAVDQMMVIAEKIVVQEEIADIVEKILVAAVVQAHILQILALAALDPALPLASAVFLSPGLVLLLSSS